MNAQPFDPYYKWLGIPSGEQPPNHYRLLGITLFEEDPDVIANAADQRMLLMKNFQTGKSSGTSQRILNEIAKTKVCLLNQEKKADYDAQLRQQLHAQAAAATPAATVPYTTAIPTPSTSCFPTSHADAPVHDGVRHQGPAGRRLVTGGATSVVLLGAFVWWLAGTQNLEPVVHKPLEHAELAMPSEPKTVMPSPAVAPFDAQQAVQHQQAWAEYLGHPVEWTNSIGMKFVLVPPGEFTMGSSEEEVGRLLEAARNQRMPQWNIDQLTFESPQHRVGITQPFYLGRCEVTQADYQRVMNDNPSRFQGNPARPVENVTWHNAVAFCRKLSELSQKEGGVLYRLPTEAEWEYACRAGTTTYYCFGDNHANLSQYAWWGNNAEGQTQPVGRLQPNAWGLFDMYGNVWEWCADCFNRDYYADSPVNDPAGPTSGQARVNRGGSWDRNAGGWRSALRDWYSPKRHSDSLGFRVVLVLSSN